VYSHYGKFFKIREKKLLEAGKKANRPKMEGSKQPVRQISKRRDDTMDKISIKTPNPKCRLYWCLIEFLDWRYSHVGIFRPAL
jgi:hypothetical protein